MNNLEAIELLWRQQTIATQSQSLPKKTPTAHVVIERDANRRGRILKWGVPMFLFGIFAAPFFSVVNYVYAGRAMAPAGLLHLGVLEIFLITLLIAQLRRIRAHSKLLKKSAANVRENAEVALEVVVEEMQDYRAAAWTVPAMLLLDMIPIINNFVSGYFDGRGLALRLVSVLALGLLVGGVALRHYRSVLRPQKRQLTDLLDDLDAG